MKVLGHQLDVKGFDKPTPTEINTYVLFICFIVTFLRTHMLKHIVFNDSIRSEIDWWLGIINEFCLGVRPFFGVNVQASYVKTDKVSAMDETAKAVIWIILVSTYFFL